MCSKKHWDEHAASHPFSHINCATNFPSYLLPLRIAAITSRCVQNLWQEMRLYRSAARVEGASGARAAFQTPALSMQQPEAMAVEHVPGRVDVDVILIDASDLPL